MIKLNLRLSGAASTLSTTAAGVTTTVTTIPLIAGAGSSVAITKAGVTDNTVSSIKFTCGASNNISYPFADFDAVYIPYPSSQSSGNSYIEFTPKSTALTGVHLIGNSVNADTSVNFPFAINTSSLNGAPSAYLAPVCTTNGAATPLPILETVMEGSGSSAHFTGLALI